MSFLRSRRVLAGLLIPLAGARAEAFFFFGQGSIPDACAANTTLVQLSDALTTRLPNDPSPVPTESDRKSEIRGVVRLLGSGASASSGGVAFTWRHPRASPRSCQAKLTELARRFPGRVRFTPAENQIETARARVAARLPARLQNGLRVDPAKSGALFDHSVARANEELLWAHGSAAPVPAWVYETLSRGQSAPRRAAPLRAAPRAPRPRAVRAASVRAAAPPSPRKPSPAPDPFLKFGRDLKDGFTGVVGGAATVVGAGLNATGDILRQTGEFTLRGAHEVVNGLFRGIEMAAGFGYTLIHAGDRHTNFGTTRLVWGVQRIAGGLRASGAVQTEMVIGDMSRWDGAKFGRHLSHRNGRDMDIGYYMVDAQGRPVQGTDLIPLDHNMRGVQDGRYVYFDAPRNWRLVRTFLLSPDFKVSWIFVAPHVKAALMKEAARVNDPLRGTAAAVLNTNWPGHHSHLHLRVE
jgi:hypothetical protein